MGKLEAHTQTHAQLTTTIVDYLRQYQHLFVYENDNPGRWRNDKQIFLKGKNPGRPDIEGALLSGNLFFTEVKVGSDYLKPDQVAWFAECRRRGIPCFCAYSLEEVVRWFKESAFFKVQAYNPKALKKLEGK